MIIKALNRDRALEVLLSRGFMVTYNAVMVLAFAAVAWFLNERGSSAQLVWTFGSGVHAGIGFMWLISPHITERWRREMNTEVELMVSRAMLQAMSDANMVMWSPSSPDDGNNGRTLQ